MRILNMNRPLQASWSLGSVLFLGLAAAICLPRLHAREESNPRPEQGSTSASPSGAAATGDEGVDLHGVVRGAGGEVVSGVKIAATEVQHEVNFADGQLTDDGLNQRPFVTSDAAGKYQFGRSTKKFGAFAFHETGYARKSAEELAESPDLKLEPWGRVEGVVQVRGKPLAGAAVHFMLDATDRHSMFYDFYDFRTVTDEEGRFVIERVPAGIGCASIGEQKGNQPVSYGHIASKNIVIKPGQHLQLNIGGEGVPVTGRLKQSAGAPIPIGGGKLQRIVSEQSVPTKFSEEEMMSWSAEKRFQFHFDAYRTPEAVMNRVSQRVISLQLEKDGGFRAEEVLAGEYLLVFWTGDDVRHPMASVPVSIAGNAIDPATPTDLGEILLASPQAE